MSKEKKKLYEYLKKRDYFELEERVSVKMLSANSSRKRLSVKAEGKKMVNAVKRFQTFSGLPGTGRVNKATLQETEKPRCGFPDITTHELLAMESTPARWTTKTITYGFGRLTPQMPPIAVIQAVRVAFGFWKMAVPTFNFQEISIDEDPMIVIKFAVRDHLDSIRFRGGDNILAHAFLPNSDELPGDIHFDDEEQWSLNVPPTHRDFLSVAIHEIGHSLGLVHSLNPDAQMFATYQGLRRGLHPEDVARIRSLYP